jgi:acyl transferase domain-containing protein
MSAADLNLPLEGIAIIGMSGRFPGARNIAEYWRNLRDGVESVSFFTDDEVEAAGVNPALLRHPDYVKARAILQDIELFDASFFGLTPREAEMTDPQQRIFMECCWEALEGAGYNADTFQGPIGLYAGVSSNSYLLHNIISNPELLKSIDALQLMIGNDKDHLTTRTSYKLNLRGPSFTVQTACSTSLVAVHVACQSLMHYQCDIALAGGASIRVPQKSGYLYQEGFIASPDGHCRAFDEQARGVVGGDGVAVVALKRLEDALVDGDEIHAVIKGSAVNNDGSLKVGYTAPSVEGQSEVIIAAHASAGVEADSIGYVEAHGTGTNLGDPVEVAALAQAFRAGTEKHGFCALGSVKTNIGHLDAAAGVAGLIKAVLSIKHRMIPPSLHFEKPNPQIDFTRTPFYVNARLSDWTAEDGTPRRAGVSSFGIGGTNAHVVLEEAPAPAPLAHDGGWQLLVQSARTMTALETATARLSEFFKQNPDCNLADVAHTLQVGRQAFKYRRMLVCRDVAGALAALETRDEQKVLTGEQDFGQREVIFLFPGQGAQYVRMASELYQNEPTFQQQVDACAESLRPHLGLDLRDILFPKEEELASASELLTQTFITQPALFVIEYALAQLWSERGIRPHAMLGHSIGEYVAACLAGVMTLEEALRLVAARGRLMQQLPSGAMLAVALAEERVRPLLKKGISIAAVNSPDDCVVSGTPEAVSELEQQLNESDVGCRRLRTSHAFHSGMVEPLREAFIEQFRGVTLRPPQTLYISNVTGTWITAQDATDPLYWFRHLRQPVRFTTGVQELLQQPGRIFLEIGPGHSLGALVKRHFIEPGQCPVLSSLPRNSEAQPEMASMLCALGQLWLAGARVDWSSLSAGAQRRRVSLPTYPFERERHWLEPNTRAEVERAPREEKPEIAEWFYLPSWKRSALPQLSAPSELKERALNWLLFTDESGFNSRLIERLKKEGQNVNTVFMAGQFAALGEHTYTINPGALDDYESLLKELRAAGQVPHVIVHLLNVKTEDGLPADAAAMARSQEMSFNSLLLLAQSLGNENLTAPLRLCVMTSDMQAVVGAELRAPMKALVLGPVRVISQEYPHIICRSIDIIVPQEETREEERLIEHLVAELAADRPERVVAYRGQHRWTQSIESLRIDELAGERLRWRDGGVFLITGGLEGIGYALAEHLAAEARATLVLTDAAAIPQREEWDGWLVEHPDDDEVSGRIRKVLALEERGALVLALGGDITDPQHVRRVVDEALKRFGEINGVIHTEERLGAGLIQLRTQEMSDAVLAPKIKGTLALDAALKDMPLDFMILCSSVFSGTGGVGMVDYCAASAFLDAYAHYKTASSETFTISIDWDIWRWNTRFDSLIQMPEIQAQFKLLREKFGITRPEGVEVLKRLMATSLSQAVVSPQDFQSAFEQPNALTAAAYLEQVEKRRSGSATHQQRAGLDDLPPQNETERVVAEIWKSLLGIEHIRSDDNFFDLGGHSLLAIQLLPRLRSAFDVELSIGSLFEMPTVSGMAALILETQIEQEFGDMDLLLDSIENLSPEEVKERLAAELQ